MNVEQMVSQVSLFGSLFAGFIAYTAYKIIRGTGPDSKDIINSNVGSIMMYCIFIAIISYFIIFGEFVLAFIWAFYLSSSSAEWYFLFYPLWYAVGGCLFAHVSMLRTKDAGKSKGFAFIGIVPIASFFLFFASPVTSPARPAYVPKDCSLRVAIGVFALLMISSLEYLTDLGVDYLEREGSTMQIVRSIEVQNADLPQEIDETTIIQSISADSSRKDIVLVYRITDASLTSEEVRSFLESSLRPQFVKDSCADPAITDYGWKMVVRYEDMSGGILAESTISRGDC